MEVDLGSYYLDVVAGLPIGNHTFAIIIDDEFISETELGELDLTVLGNLNAEIPDIPPADGGETFDVNVFISDNYGTTPSDTWVIVEINGQNFTAEHVTSTRFTVELNATYSIGAWNFTVYYGSSFSQAEKRVCDLYVLSDPTTEVSSPDEWEVTQGESTSIDVQVHDWLGIPIVDATVSIFVRGTTYYLDYISDGIYSTDISTVGWPSGPQNFYLSVSHEYLHQFQSSGELRIRARPTITIKPATFEPEQFSSLLVTIDVTDFYDNPISNLTVTVMFNEANFLAEETEVRGTYSVVLDLSGIKHGLKTITVFVEGELAEPTSDHIDIQIMVYIPPLDMTSTQISMAAGLSLLLSLIGMFLFVKVSSVVSTKPRKDEDVTRSINQLDRIYVIIIAASVLIFLHSYSLSLEGAYIYSLLESILLLGSSVLLYGLWLYRDAYSSILRTGKISKKRVVMGTWHLVLVLFIVLLIFDYGEHIEAFQWFVLEHVVPFTFGDLIIVPMMATMFATYMSSIVVVVVSFYREIRKGLSRIDDMISSGTPKNVVDEEQALLIGRTGSSIRIKFLMFLMILGATTVMQLDFLRTYSMAAIILIPIVFLVLIPFISSRIIRRIPGMSKHAEVEEILSEMTKDSPVEVDSDKDEGG